jgi:hypothetical protein
MDEYADFARIFVDLSDLSLFSTGEDLNFSHVTFSRNHRFSQKTETVKKGPIPCLKFFAKKNANFKLIGGGNDKCLTLE